MKRLFIVLMLMSALPTFVRAQNGELTMKKNFWGTKFYRDNSLITFNEAVSATKSNEAAYTEMKKAKSNYVAAMIFSTAGGFMIGYPIGTAIGGGDPAWGLAAGGGVLLLAAIPLNAAFNKHVSNGINIYNGKDSSSRGVSFTMTPYVGGAKVVLRF